MASEYCSVFLQWALGQATLASKRYRDAQGGGHWDQQSQGGTRLMAVERYIGLNGRFASPLV
jgi:hypothetical protein